MSIYMLVNCVFFSYYVMHFMYDLCKIGVAVDTL